MMNILLQRAAGIAAKMPKLEIMEIWNGGEGLAALFQYRIQQGKGEIYWRATWGISLDASVIRAWEALTPHLKARLDIYSERIDKKLIRHLGDAIHYLGHSKRVLRPVSLHQLRLEGPHRADQT